MAETDKILVVQDSPLISKILKIRLEAVGFSVDTAETGEEGIQKAMAVKYQVILLDYQLPGIDGAEVCRILKKEDNTKKIPVLFVSATDKKQMIEIIKSAGADGCLTTSFRREEFIDGIKKAIKNSGV